MKRTIQVCISVATLALLQSELASAQEMSKGSYGGLGDESVESEIIKRYAPKTIPAELSRAISREVDVSAGGNHFLLTPNGKRMVFNWGVTGHTQIWRIDESNTFPVQLTGGEDNTRVETITPNGLTLVVQRDRKGEENPGLYLQSIEGGPLVEIQHKPRVQTGFGAMSRSGRTLYFTANDISPESYAIYAYDLATKEKRTLYTEPGRWKVAEERRDGQELLVYKWVTSTVREYFLFDLKTRKTTPLLGSDGETYEIRYGRTPGEYIVTTNRFSDFSRAYIYRDTKFNPITPEMPYEVDECALNEAGSRIWCIINRGGYLHTQLLDVKTLRVKPLPKLPLDGDIEASDRLPSGRFSIFTVHSELTPDVTYVYDWKSGKSRQWTKPSTPELDVSQYVKAKLDFYPARDGTKIPMFVYRPAACETKNCPVIANFHGGPEGQSRPRFHPGIQRYLRDGFVYVLPNVRGSLGYGKKWLDSDNGPKRLEVITDIEDLAQYVKKAWAKNGVVPKVGIIGGSYGGYATLVGMSMFAGAYDAGVASVGMSNLVTFLQNTAPYRRALRISEYGDPERDLEALKKLSPISYIDRIKSPLLILQGVNDPRVPVGEAVQIQKALETRGVASELALFPDSGHGPAGKNDAIVQLGLSYEFFRRHLN